MGVPVLFSSADPETSFMQLTRRIHPVAGEEGYWWNKDGNHTADPRYGGGLGVCTKCPEEGAHCFGGLQGCARGRSNEDPENCEEMFEDGLVGPPQSWGGLWSKPDTPKTDLSKSA